MRNKAYRHHRAARLGAALGGPEKRPYVITDKNHRPDLRGEFAGAKVEMRDGKQVVVLSDRAARFYLDQGALAPLLDA